LQKIYLTNIYLNIKTMILFFILKKKINFGRKNDKDYEIINQLQYCSLVQIIPI